MSEANTVLLIQRIAEAAKDLGAADVDFGVNDAVANMLAVLPCATARATIFEEPGETYVIESVGAQVDGIRFRVQRHARPATPHEMTQLEREDVQEHRTEYRAVGIP